VNARLVVAAIACLGLVAVGLLARPARYEVDGLSMAPGVMPGDVVATQPFPAADRARRPERFERWIVDSPADGSALKRVVGLPGETLAIVNGDLLIDGMAVLKSPRVLAEVGIELATITAGPSPGRFDLPLTEVLDDAPFATEVNRILVPVNDLGIAAVVRTATGAAEIRLTGGGRRVTWRLTPHTRGCFVAGRLDGCFVATAWKLPLPLRAVAGGRGCLPAAPPTSAHEKAWAHEEAWPAGDADSGSGWSAEIDDPAAIVERVWGWRDVHYRPADGVAEWRLGAGSFLVLGDFPTASRDSRHWGPLAREALRHRLAP
jgi:type IV secretory pathway protease TraF